MQRLFVAPKLLVNLYPVTLFVVVLRDFLVCEFLHLHHRVVMVASLVVVPYPAVVASLVAYPEASFHLRGASSVVYHPPLEASFHLRGASLVGVRHREADHRGEVRRPVARGVVECK